MASCTAHADGSTTPPDPGNLSGRRPDPTACIELPMGRPARSCFVAGTAVTMLLPLRIAAGAEQKSAPATRGAEVARVSRKGKPGRASCRSWAGAGNALRPIMSEAIMKIRSMTIERVTPGFITGGGMSFEPPPLESPLWRYLDFARFVALLERKALFFSAIDGFLDPFEASLTPALRVQLEAVSARMLSTGETGRA
jgi:hypothetical protein